MKSKLRYIVLLLFLIQLLIFPIGYSLGKSHFEKHSPSCEATHLELTRPNGGENWLAGSHQSIRWNSTHGIGGIRIKYSVDGEKTWHIIRDNVVDNGRYDFIVPLIESDLVFVKIQSTEQDSIFDVSDSSFSIFYGTQVAKKSCIPRPVTLTIDDVGWKLGRDDSDKNGPYRLGVNRDPVFRDYEVLVYVAKKIGVRLSGRFVLSEFDRNNILAQYPTTNEWGNKWDNSKLIRKSDFKIMDYLKENCAWLELGIHGVRHEYWDWENENGQMVRTEFYDEIHNKPWPYDILEGHLLAFQSILEQYGIQSFPESYTTPGNGYDYQSGNNNKDSGALFHSMGVKYAITDIIQTGNYGMPKQAILDGGIIDNGVLLIQQSRYVPHWPKWNAINSPPKAIPPFGIPITHWPNWWAQNPQDDFEVGDKFISWFQKIDKNPDVYVPRNTAQYYSQWLYRKYCQTQCMGTTIILDNRRMPDEAYQDHLLGNIVLKLKLSTGVHISRYNIDQDAEVVGYFEKKGFAYLFISMLEPKIYHLTYEFGPKKLKNYIWNDGTYNIREFKTAQNGVYINLEWYGQQDLKVIIPFHPDFVRLIADSLMMLHYEYNDVNRELTVTLKNNAIIGRTGRLIIGKDSFGKISFSGALRYYSNGELIPDVGMAIRSEGKTFQIDTIENPFHINNFELGATYTFVPYKNSNNNNRISTLYDAALVARYSVGLNSLNKFQRLAADVSGDGVVMMYDALMIARYAVGLPVAGHSYIDEWKFYPDSLVFNTVTSNQDNVNFIGYVVGDVSGKWPSSSKMPEIKRMKNKMLEKIMEVSGDTLSIKLGKGYPNKIVSVYADMYYPKDRLRFLGIEKKPTNERFKIFLNNNHGRLRFGALNLQRIISGNTQFEIKFLLSGESKDLFNVIINTYKINNIPMLVGKKVVRMYKKVTRSFRLLQNYPNPFNGITRIPYYVPRRANIRLSIFNSLGKKIGVFKDEEENEGWHDFNWAGRDKNGQRLPSGIYFVEIRAENMKERKKIILLN